LSTGHKSDKMYIKERRRWANTSQLGNHIYATPLLIIGFRPA
jgi:hypothetical protein